MTHRIRPAVSEDIPAIIALAAQAWQETYPGIISQAQIDYSIKEMYAPELLQRYITTGEQPILVAENANSILGFSAYQWKDRSEGIKKLCKLYLHPSSKGRGLGKALVEAVEHVAATAGAGWLDLNVNRSNPARFFYEKCGFVIVQEEDVLIGPYVMEDYVMRKAVAPPRLSQIFSRA